MISWDKIEVVLLDMDGTLLDLHYDNYFWQEYLPQYWSRRHKMSLQEAKNALIPLFNERRGTLSWYCLDHWSAQFNLNLMELKADIEHLIKVRPHVEEFMQFLSESDMKVLMVTNAHEKLISVKMEKTGIDRYFDEIISAHTLGHAKEEEKFWEKLNGLIPFDRESALLIDDNQSVLNSARLYGIKYLYTIAQPDSQAPPRDNLQYTSIESFNSIYESNP